MDRTISVIAVIIPIIALAAEFWLLYAAYTDLMRRPDIPNRLLWAFIIVFFPILGPVLYLTTFRNDR